MLRQVCRLATVSLISTSVLKYPEIGDLSCNITKQWQGNTVDTVTDREGKIVTKHIVWTTAGVRGTEWRLVFSRTVTNPPEINDIFNQTII